MPDTASETSVAEHTAPALLAADDPPPFEVLNPDGRARALLICDHASRAVPQALDCLGLDDAELRRHIGWDIGAADVTRRLAELMDAPAVLSGWSRLVIDPNRLLEDPTSIPEISDGTVVPGNRALEDDGRAARVEALFRPYHSAVEAQIERARARGAPPALVSVHSFTPVMKTRERPWQVGILWGQDPRLAVPLIDWLARQPGLIVGDNEPYSGRAGFGYSIERHGTDNGLPNALIEVRQDLIDTHHGAADWAGILARALDEVLADAAVWRELQR